MTLRRFAVYLGVFLLISLSSAAPSTAKTFPLNGGGGQFAIGRIFMMPLQAPFTPAVTKDELPPLLIPVVPGPPMISGTTGKSLKMFGGKKGYQHRLTIPANVFSKPAAQTYLGIKAFDPVVFAVGTNLQYQWPSAVATFSTGVASPNVIIAHGGSMIYSNRLGSRFGGPASFVLAPGPAAG